MSIINTWKAFIQAQEVFINQYAEPFTISFRKTDNDGLLQFDIEKKNPLNSVSQIIRQAFPEINEDDINIKAGYLLYDSTLSPKISEEILAEAEANYLEFDQTPCFTGSVHAKSDAFRWLKEDIGIQGINQGECFATLSQLKKFDQVIQEKKDFSRLPAIGGIFKVKPSQHYISKALSTARFVSDVTNTL